MLKLVENDLYTVQNQEHKHHGKEQHSAYKGKQESPNCDMADLNMLGSLCQGF